MPDLSERVSGLSAEKRELLQKLVRKQPPAAGVSAAAAAVPAAHHSAVRVPPPAAPPAPALQPAATDLSLTFGQQPEQVKTGFRQFYDAVSTQLDSTVFGDFSFFLNYGYVPNLSPQLSQVELPEHFINKNSVRLVLEVVADCDLSGRRVLDVGCGRGGTVHVINRFFKPASITGLDLAPAAIAFNRRVHKYPGVSFEVGDAENLPFADGAFDAVTNIESSHSYPNIRSFYSEVYRVLAPGGYFLYTDVHPLQQWIDNIAFLESLGFQVEADRDITSNVLLSCDEVASNRVSAFHSGNDPHLMKNFLATPDSEVYIEMRDKRWKYSILKLKK